ncbi:low affinity iron permease family protein [Sphingomonas sp. MAH-20]|jgi:low affinity Fe/Cu permease|uniref:Low affinity iron permease family protein n=1 Tax=Sphingomonas horti TaxID=2682842 RepID=A0A6I4J1K7_9SPHN|nr:MULTISPECIES: low affinity iron permease family protein [Sphingomonas]MBA2921089.1 low affinity iron permease family protein [Sphingomonas sp. CGMCC 1.13658]MVO78154.1 low affinity iron permease family protein [Sphingomonas horti]
MDRIFTHIATRIANASGQPITFIVALLLIVIWAATGPAFHYSDTWQLIVNTSTTIVTFLMVFLIQNSQNRDASAMQAKLDELIRSVDKAREQFIGIEHLTDLEICEIRDALEKEVAEAEDKQRTADDTVDRLLKRHYRIRRREMRKANAG